MKAIRRFNVRSVLPESISELGELAINLRWSWHTATRTLFEETAPIRWEQVGHDPVALLSSLSADELSRLAADPDYVARVKAAYTDMQSYLTQPRWYQQWADEVDGTVPSSIAYFSAEFGITEVLPQYSGGLGILAGDHLKSASDLGVPVVGVGLFYQTGYFAQSLNRDGWQQETYPVLDPDGLPLSLLRDADDKPVLVELSIPGHRTLRAFVWKAQVGRVPLLLLDSDVHENDPDLRTVTNRLYGGGGEQRLLQEMLLGIGGVRALRAWSALTGAPDPDVYHCNEGHAGFLGVERIHELVTQHNLTFDEAVEATRAATVFTTHTPVPAGIDRFGVDQIRHYFGGDNALDGVPVDRLLALGAETYEGGEAGVFNMAVMGLRMAKHSNGVSKLHGIVSRDMFHGLWPGFDDSEVPITSITNGVHAPTWVDQRIFDLSDSYGPLESSSAKIAQFAERATDEQIWGLKRELRQTLVEMARTRMRDSWAKRGAARPELGWTDSILDPDVLTIGFARRVPTYKRLTLMLRDPERLKRLLLHPERPMQLVIAGKSHPADDNGKRLIQKMVQFADDPEIRHRIVFLPNYDIGMARHLYPGCDVWLNNPLRPLEACGTSGMKAALNGGLNLSILDGWWDEWYDGENGWDIPTADGIADPDRRDDIEAAALYDLIENRVAPRFYDVDEHGVPRRWVAMMRHTLATLGPKVLATRQVQDYTRDLYVPAARANHTMADRGFDAAKELAAYRSKITSAWSTLHVDHVESSGVADSPQVGDTFHIKAFISLGVLRPEDVDVQVVYGHVDANDQLSNTSTYSLHVAESYEGGRHRFEGEMKVTETGSFGYTVRVVPTHRHLTTPAEFGLAVNA
ncbi:alpha-glucan family phosphorylase [Austwickia sp. TVS 96-490-7B]|uniref:alpha-glucan family phosphorylase n=1 Tax=Austwickia sp. TVS 96-490-7B TaxID=2830843 RepID=UPI001C597BBA|nr:alpha-glucan family phosphorylase [Austwickia sp. TVS 96-490-7B]